MSAIGSETLIVNSLPPFFLGTRFGGTGGSAVASDTIYREVLKTKESGKPVVVFYRK